MKITTAGESHGKGLFAIIEGLPSGLVLDMGAIDAALMRRRSGYGRGERQRIECDKAEILSGIMNAATTGSPLTIAIWNRDEGSLRERPLTSPRPGHADLAGAMKFHLDDARAISERASARESAVRVAAGEICRQLLGYLGVSISGYIRSVGTVSDEKFYPFSALTSRDSELGMLDEMLCRRAKAGIDEASASGDTLGGVVEVRVDGLKSGFGSCMTYAEKLDARISGALMSIQAAKGVEWGAGFAGAALRGSAFHDEIFLQAGRPFRKTNRAGGVEGGMSNGEELAVRVAMKPIPTLQKGLASFELSSGKKSCAAIERGDVCAILAFEQICESVVASELCAAVLARLGGDTLCEVISRYGELPL